MNLRKDHLCLQLQCVCSVGLVLNAVCIEYLPWGSVWVCTLLLLNACIVLMQYVGLLSSNIGTSNDRFGSSGD